MSRTTEIPEKYKNRPIYSISRLESFHGCQYNYYKNYICRESSGNNIYGLLGEEVHSLLEKLQFNMISKTQALEDFRRKLFEITEILGYKFPSEKIHNSFVQCVEHYLSNYKPTECKEFKSEERFYTEINGIVLTGFIDGIIILDSGEAHVLDYKTSTKYTGQALHDHARQLVLYAIALKQEYGMNVTKVMWSMLKYVNISFLGATKPRKIFALRTEIVKSLKSELLKDLRKLNMEDFAIEMLLEKAIETNDMTCLPKEVCDKYIIEDGIVEYPLNDESIQNLIDFVTETVQKIESKPTADASVWKPKDIDKEGSFFCNVLCGRPTCPHYQQWTERNKDKFEKIGNISPVDELKGLFG